MKNAPAVSAALPQRLAEARVRHVVCSSTPPEEGRAAKGRDAFAIDRHGHREMLYVLEGRSSFLYRDRVWALEPGTLVAVDAWETHAFGYRASDDGLLHLWLGQHPSSLTCACLGVEKGRYRSAARFDSLTGAAFEHLSRDWGNVSAGTWDVPFRTSLLAGVAEAILRAFAVEMACAAKSGDAARGLADFVAEYIARQHGRDCSLARLERVTGYSRFYLSRLFRRQRGTTIGAAVAEARRRYFAEATARGLKQRTIAEALGFSSPSAFCLWKRRLEDMSKGLDE
ncbi:MAG: helix-turn-helix transcriptional regulator [Kiritimatiellae bacterium]|nr:helix-turn-helix transcriptional regulator [Kiritimatiellia bacterium]